MAAAARRRRNATAVSIATLGLLAATAGACSGDGARPLARAALVSIPDEPVDGGRIRLGLAGPIVVDPVDASVASPSDLMVLDLLHDGLTRVGIDGVVAGDLARSWTSDPSQRTWTFTLDPAATFASGERVTSADVVRSIERVAAGGDTSLAALRLEPISGFQAFVDGTADHLAGLTATDATTVHVALDTPLSVLPEVLASPVFGVVDAASLEGVGEEGMAQLDLSGAWAVEEAADDRLTLERREGEDGYLDAVELRSYEDEAAAYGAFAGGTIDWTPVPAASFAEGVERYGDDHFAPFHAELFLGMNVTSPSLGDPVLRQAIALAIDREAIATAVYGDLAEPLAHVVPAGVPVADPARPGAGHDPARAAALVAQVFPNGGVPEIHVDFDASPAQAAMVEIVAENLEAVGIPTRPRPLPLEDYKRFVVSGAPELFSFGWVGVYRSPDAYLAPLFHSASADNLSRFGDVDVDAMLATARGTTDRAVQLDQWAQAEARVLAASVVVPIAQFRTQVLVGARVQGLRHAADGSVDWAEVWVTSGS